MYPVEKCLARGTSIYYVTILMFRSSYLPHVSNPYPLMFTWVGWLGGKIQNFWWHHIWLAPNLTEGLGSMNLSMNSGRQLRMSRQTNMHTNPGKSYNFDPGPFLREGFQEIYSYMVTLAIQVDRHCHPYNSKTFKNVSKTQDFHSLANNSHICEWYLLIPISISANLDECT